MSSPTVSQVTIASLEYLGLQVRDGRRQRGWTESELAERAGVSRSTIRSLEDGSPSVRIGTVLEAAHLVGLHPVASPSELPTLLDHQRQLDRLRPAPTRATSDDDF